MPQYNLKEVRKEKVYPEDLNQFVYDVVNLPDDKELIEKIKKIDGNKKAFGRSKYYLKKSEGEFKPFFEVKFQWGIFTDIKKVDIVYTEKGAVETEMNVKNPNLRY